MWFEYYNLLIHLCACTEEIVLNVSHQNYSDILKIVCSLLVMTSGSRSPEILKQVLPNFSNAGGDDSVVMVMT